MSGLTATGRKHIEEVAQTHLVRDWHTGAQIAVYRNGRLEIDLSVGEAIDRRMLWFSTTKPVTAVAILMLAERGRLDLDAPVVGIWPEFAQGGKAACTTRHVLTHRGGFPIFPSTFNWSQIGDWATVSASTAAISAQSAPGTEVAYHPVTYGFALGEVLRRADPRRRSPRSLLRDSIFVPLGMNASLGTDDLQSVCMPVAMSEVTIADPTGSEARTSDIVRRFSLPSTIRGQLPAANGIGTAEALARFYAMLVGGGELNGVRLLSKATVAEATHAQVTTERDRTTGLPASYGLGFLVGGIWPPFDVPGVFGHSGQQCAVSWGDPETGIAAAYLTNGLQDPNVIQARTSEMFYAVRGACN